VDPITYVEESMSCHVDDPGIIAVAGQHTEDRRLGVDRCSRRQFVTSLAALAAGTVLPGATFQAQAVTRAVSMIDVHHHIFPPAFLAAAKDSFSNPASRARLVSEWTAQKALAQMEENGVAAAIVSITNPGIWFGDVQAARSLARNCNEYAAQLARDHPDRFGFFAAVPLPDTEGSLREIAYALDVLKADGIGLLTSYGDKWPGDPAYAGVFDELNRRKAVVYFHPTAPNCCRGLMPEVPDALTEFPHDTTRAITSLLYSGSFARFQDIRFIFSHAGGTIPMLAGRISQVGGSLFGIDNKVPRGVEHELKRLHYEIANSANRSTIAALMNLVPTSQIMFGSDYPFVPTGVTVAGMVSLGLSAGDLQMIGRENAQEMFPRLRAP
jgi:predicted TIM-barrel fold metal-dependent hydrolase